MYFKGPRKLRLGYHKYFDDAKEQHSRKLPK